VRHPLLSGALAILVVVGAIVAAGSFSVPANAVTVDGTSISQATLNQDLATIQKNAAFGCYLDASVEVRSGGEASVPSLVGQSSSGSYSTAFVDFWLSQVINNLLIERLAAAQHLPLDATALAAGRADLSGSIGATLTEAAAASGQSAVCAASGEAIVSTLPSSLVDELVRAQAAGDVVLAHAAGYGLGAGELDRYFTAHPASFQTICLSAIEVASQSTATTIRQAIEAGEPFATAAKADSTDTTSAPNGGALGCYSANEGAYPTVASDVKGLAIGQISQPVADNSSYLLLEVTSEEPAAFGAVQTAVRQAILSAGSAKASKELSTLTKTAQVSVDPRYGRWAGATGIGIEGPKAPVAADLLNPGT
jgi:parvulin-like peptidyl-prolyl isomerase